MTDPTSLQNLNDIVMPPAPGIWPPAPGWYVVFVVVLLLFIKIALNTYKVWKTNRYRTEALEQLTQIQEDMRKGEKSVLKTLPALVKGTALRAYPRKNIAGLYGTEWLSFLDETIGSDQFSKGPGKLLPHLSYQTPEQVAVLADSDIQQCLELVRSWIVQHKHDALIQGGV